MTGFEAGVQAWISGLGAVRDTVRQALVAEQLAAHLPGPAPLRILDAGCGQGTQAIALASAGHDVTGVDTSAELLERARCDAAAAGVAVRFETGDVLSLESGGYDVVCCHGVAMYLPSLAELCGVLGAAARPGGLVSLLTRNRAGIAMRAGMTGDWAGALAGFDATRYTNRVGVVDARADDPDDVRAAFAAAGASVVAWYGVRLLCDHWDADAVADDLEGLLAAEREAARRDPYRRLAALTHTVACARGPTRR